MGSVKTRWKSGEDGRAVSSVYLRYQKFVRLQKIYLNVSFSGKQLNFLTEKSVIDERKDNNLVSKMGSLTSCRQKGGEEVGDTSRE